MFHPHISGLLSVVLCQDPLGNFQPRYGSDLVADYSELDTEYAYDDDYDPNDIPPDQAKPSEAPPAMSGIDMLRMAVPGSPGEDYPIYAAVPDTSFACDGRVEGGYYADVEGECQPFHVCTADGHGGLTKYSFLCPNGTLFQQEYLVCDWWFNVDCSVTRAR